MWVKVIETHVICLQYKKVFSASLNKHFSCITDIFLKLYQYEILKIVFK